jgi:hypothetical protein
MKFQTQYRTITITRYELSLSRDQSIKSTQVD